jgi:hypothetical protein
MRALFKVRSTISRIQDLQIQERRWGSMGLGDCGGSTMGLGERGEASLTVVALACCSVQSFDADGSGEIDASEFNGMLVTAGVSECSVILVLANKHKHPPAPLEVLGWQA